MSQSWSKREASCLEESSCETWGSYSILVLSRFRRGFFLKSQIDCRSMWEIGWGWRKKFHTGLLVEREGDGPDAWEKTDLKLYHLNLPLLILVKSFRICHVDFLLCHLSGKCTCQVTERWWKCKPKINLKIYLKLFYESFIWYLLWRGGLFCLPRHSS